MVVNLTKNHIAAPKEISKKDDIQEKRVDKTETTETIKNEKSDKIQKIKEMIKKGEYKIDIEATAKKIAEERL